MKITCSNGKPVEKDGIPGSTIPRMSPYVAWALGLGPAQAGESSSAVNFASAAVESA